MTKQQMTQSEKEQKYILIVDDDKVLADELEKVLCKSGYKTLTAYNA